MVGVGRATCPGGSDAPGRSAAPRRRGSAVEACTPSRAISTTSSGRTCTTCPSLGADGDRCSALGLPAQQLVGQPLERLADHHEVAVVGPRAPRWRFDSQPWRRPWPHSTASTTRSSVCTGLTLRHAPPRRPASYGDVERLHHHALVAGGDGAVEERRRLVGVGGDDRRERGTRRRRPTRSSARRTASGSSIDGRAVGVEHVEEGGDRPTPRPRRAVGAEVAHRVLEATRGAVVVDAEHLAVEHEVAAGQRRRRLDDARAAGR